MWDELWELGGWESLRLVMAAAGIYLVLIVYSRIIGPRSFSQMTAFDFAVTVAIGAIVGSTAISGALGPGMVALTSLFAFRGLVAALRPRGLNQLVDNRPVLLMRDGRFLDDQLKQAKVTRDDVLEALRSSGVTSRDQVAAVIIERNGGMSVLRRGGEVDPAIIANVEGAGIEDIDGQET